MRIQHNIMAMNAYRNYNNNNKALSGNLEKLSSGYKINRAGDDAAGLAISEKMRAQITGLNAASKNVKDGISLVKTAEGAMQEIQDMLNRMDYLATQSANGTYDNEVDRKALQKEVNQLNDEINRIADSANFNGIKLLDGTWDTDAVVKAQEALDKAKQPVTADAVYTDKTTDEVKGLMLAQSTSNEPTNATDGVGKATILETDGKGEVVPSFKVSMNGISHVFTTDGGDNTKTIKFTITDTAGTTKDVQITEQELATALGGNKKEGDKVSSADLAKALATKNAATDYTLDGVDFNITADGENLVFTAKANHADLKNAHFQVKLDGVGEGNVAASKGAYTTGTLSQTNAAGDKDTTVTIKYTDADGKAKEKDVTFKSGTTDAGTFTNLKAAIEADDDLKDLFAVSGDKDGIVLTSKTAGAKAPAVTGVVVKTKGDDEVAIANGNAVAGKDAYTNGTNGYSNFGTQDIKVNVAGTKDQLASTTIDLAGLLTDGAKIKLGDTEYTIAVGPDSKYANAENAVKVNAGATEAEIASALTDAADKNGTFTVGHEKDTAKITLKQKAEVKDTTDMSSMDKFAGYIGISTVDATATAEAQKKLDAEQAEKVADAQAKLDAAVKAGGKYLNLQIGDTSDSYNQLGVKIGSMKTTALGVDGLSIATAEDAAAAIDTIKNAINYVSGVRGDLGAYQNRLEHTSNNLSVMAENIQDAESTIRDTDVAEEMMSYVKNNILVQSAQAMLAQANQVPQGVLQLLG